MTQKSDLENTGHVSTYFLYFIAFTLKSVPCKDNSFNHLILNFLYHVVGNTSTILT